MGRPTHLLEEIILMHISRNSHDKEYYVYNLDGAEILTPKLIMCIIWIDGELTHQRAKWLTQQV